MSPQRQHRWWGMAIVLAIVGGLSWLLNNFYYNEYVMRVPIQPLYHTVLTIVRPDFQHISHSGYQVVWTQISGEDNPAQAPWHRDWLITITGTVKNPWGLHHVHYDIYINGQHGGIEGWFIPLSHPLLSSHP
ncbi:hypothetical protein [Sulfobacillus thermosulfidooxidans]|uniref:hypothetical protein n=1 Tax=Sulfobacillus thermosulfidooxidans TaxID=28034 RepID=UPI00048C983F|nr:hypothetical protein [Sulfobacillus thermosulfidooxidans]